jgi:hypothetical protein
LKQPADCPNEPKYEPLAALPLAGEVNTGGQHLESFVIRVQRLYQMSPGYLWIYLDSPTAVDFDLSCFFLQLQGFVCPTCLGWLLSCTIIMLEVGIMEK